MDSNELKLKHPELFKAVFEEGEKSGVAKERDRVCAHLKMGVSSGDMKTATEAVKSGAEMTQSLMADYMSASMNRNDRSARQEASDQTEQTLSGATAPAAGEPGATDQGDLLMAYRDQKKKQQLLAS